MTQRQNYDGNSAVQLAHVTRTYKRDEFEVRSLELDRKVASLILRKPFLNRSQSIRGEGKNEQ